MSVLDLVTTERDDPEADVLIMTNFWPRPEVPNYGVIAERQVDSLRDGGLRVRALFVHGYRTPLAYVLAALKLISWSVRPRRRFRIVHAHGGELALVARCYLRAPLVVTYYGTDLMGRPGLYSLRFSVRQALVRVQTHLVQAAVVQSRQMAACLPGRVRTRTAVIPNGIDTIMFHPGSGREARDELGWPAEVRIVLFAGDPEYELKRFDLAQAACRVAEQALGPIRLEVAWGVSPDEVPTWMRAADCLLLTSSSEGSPNVVKEAAMCNLPVVTTRVGDVEDVLAPVTPSWICEADPDELGAALVACLRAPVRSNGSMLSSRLSLHSIAERLVALYGRLEPGLAHEATSEAVMRETSGSAESKSSSPK